MSKKSKEILLSKYVKEAARVAVKRGLSKEAYIDMAGHLFDTCQNRKQQKQQEKQNKNDNIKNL